jgi:hypothetical protein
VKCKYIREKGEMEEKSGNMIRYHDLRRQILFIRKSGFEKVKNAVGCRTRWFQRKAK